MGCGCCGGPLVGGTGFATTAKHAPTGHVMWYVDSGLARNQGVYFDGLYYELSAPTSGSNTILRSLDPDTGAEVDRRDMGNLRLPYMMLVKGGNLYAFQYDLLQLRIDLIDTADLSSTWTHSSSPSTSTITRRMIDGNYVVWPFIVATVNTWQAYQNGTTLLWSLGVTASQTTSFHCVDSNGYFVGSGTSGGSPTLKRYNSSGSLVDTYTAAAPITSVAADGTNLWLLTRDGSSDYVVLLDNSLSEVFSPVTISNDDTGGWIVPVSGAAYVFTKRYVSRVNTSGTLSARHDHGASSFVGFDLKRDQDEFVVVDRPAASNKLLNYDDSSSPSSLSWTMDPSLFQQSLSQYIDSERFCVSHDPDGNYYVSGGRVADTAFDKVP